METEEEIIEDFEDSTDQQSELQDLQMDSYEGVTVPEMKEQQNLYKWFWQVVSLKKPFELVKVGNLNKVEIGEVKIPVRECLNLAHLGEIFNHKTFAQYFATQAKISSATSMAKQGWFMDLSISQKRVRERSKSASQGGGEEKWKMFNRKKKQQERD